MASHGRVLLRTILQPSSAIRPIGGPSRQLLRGQLQSISLKQPTRRHNATQQQPPPNGESQQQQLPPQPPLPDSRLARALKVTIFTMFCVSIGYSLQFAWTMQSIQDQLVQEEIQESVVHPHSQRAEVEAFIESCDLAKELRSKPEFVETRPHLKIPLGTRAMSLTAGTLTGPDKIVAAPYVWTESGGKSLVSITYLGKDLCGHPGIVHGGLTATLLDEGLARCCFPALPSKVAVTANLNINYRSPAKADNYFVLRAETTKIEGRKAWVSGRLETLPRVPGEQPQVIAEATALFIEPRNAAMFQRLLPPSVRNA